MPRAACAGVLWRVLPHRAAHPDDAARGRRGRRGAARAAAHRDRCQHPAAVRHAGAGGRALTRAQQAPPDACAGVLAGLERQLAGPGRETLEARERCQALERQPADSGQQALEARQRCEERARRLADSGREAHEARERSRSPRWPTWGRRRTRRIRPCWQRWLRVAAPARLARLLARVHHLGLMEAHARLARLPPRFVQLPRAFFAALARLARLLPGVGQLQLSAAKRSRSQAPVNQNNLPSMRAFTARRLLRTPRRAERLLSCHSADVGRWRLVTGCSTLHGD